MTWNDLGQKWLWGDIMAWLMNGCVIVITCDHVWCPPQWCVYTDPGPELGVTTLWTSSNIPPTLATPTYWEQRASQPQGGRVPASLWSDIPSLIKHEANIPMVQPPPAWCDMGPMCHENMSRLSRGCHTHILTPTMSWLYYRSKNNSFLWIVIAPKNCTPCQDLKM